MMCQSRKNPKTSFQFSITNDNYDFLYHVASRNDTSIARELNRLIEESRESAITSCNSVNSERKLNEGHYA